MEYDMLGRQTVPTRFVIAVSGAVSVPHLRVSDVSLVPRNGRKDILGTKHCNIVTSVGVPLRVGYILRRFVCLFVVLC